jgi:DNA-binding Lrp family transcriptional regulator
MGRKAKGTMTLKDARRKAGHWTRGQRKALARELLRHPIRMRILGWLSGRAKAHTQREIGRALSLSNAGVHYHLKLLESAGLVKLDGTRPGPNSITEKLYSADPREWKETAAMDDKAKSEFYLDHTLASVHEMHREAAELIKSSWHDNPFLVGCYETYATEADIKKLYDEVTEILEAFHRRHRKPKQDCRPLAVTFGLLPSKAAGWGHSQRVFSIGM